MPTQVCRGASIGSGARYLGGVTIGERAMVGAGAVVTGTCRRRDRRRVPARHARRCALTATRARTQTAQAG